MVDAPSLWFDALSFALKEEGFVSSVNDPCLFIDVKNQVLLLTYVDDSLLLCKDQQILNELVNTLRNKHPLTEEDIGNDVYDYLVIEVVQEANNITLKQEGLMKKILKTSVYTDLKTSVLTPAKDSPSCLYKHGEPFAEDLDDRRVVGMLLYLVNTRLDIQYAVHSCCRFVHSPRKSHAFAIKRICRYFIATKDNG